MRRSGWVEDWSNEELPLPPPVAAGAGCRSLPAADNAVSEQWRQIASETDGMVGAVVLHLGSGRRASLNGSGRFPLASVCKLPIAAHLLAMADEDRISLDEELEIPRRDVWPGVSIVAERWEKQHRFRLDELLPAGTVVAHKTGTTATAGDLNGATNDAGVVLLPEGAGQLAIAVYVKGSTRDQATRERVIARIAKAAFDSWSNLS